MTYTSKQTDLPLVVNKVAQLRELLDTVRRRGETIGLVPTMGALHEGHLSLVRRSKTACDVTVVSIFVNPTQFGPDEDLAEYPRTLDADLRSLADCNVEFAFVPSNEEVYCPDHRTWVEVTGVTDPLEGKCRPDHFRGVTTVVLKLFNMVGADVAYFGQKDYQQAMAIRRMVADLNVPTRIEVCPTVREPDGLAMSSRNTYLDPNARRRALVLYESLEMAKQLVDEGNRDAREIAERMRQVIAKAEDARIDYVALADPETLEPVGEITGPTVALLAVHIADTRLIDNRLLEPSL